MSVRVGIREAVESAWCDCEETSFRVDESVADFVGPAVCQNPGCGRLVFAPIRRGPDEGKVLTGHMARSAAGLL